MLGGPKGPGQEACVENMVHPDALRGALTLEWMSWEGQRGHPPGALDRQGPALQLTGTYPSPGQMAP